MIKSMTEIILNTGGEIELIYTPVSANVSTKIPTKFINGHSINMNEFIKYLQNIDTIVIEYEVEQANIEEINY